MLFLLLIVTLQPANYDVSDDKNVVQPQHAENCKYAITVLTADVGNNLLI